MEFWRRIIWSHRFRVVRAFRSQYSLNKQTLLSAICEEMFRLCSDWVSIVRKTCFVAWLCAFLHLSNVLFVFLFRFVWFMCKTRKYNPRKYFLISSYLIFFNCESFWTLYHEGNDVFFINQKLFCYANLRKRINTRHAKRFLQFSV